MTHARVLRILREIARGEALSDDAVALVERQLAAYNARDLARFIACFGDDITVWRVPATVPALAGKAQFAAFYASERFNREGLRAEIVNRIVLGQRVIDHERIHGLSDEPIEVAVAYEIAGGLIVRIHSFAAA